MLVQVHNVRILGNMLQATRTDKYFRLWARTLKVVVGALHHYSWAISAVALGLLTLVAVEIAVHVLKLSYISILASKM